MKKELKDFIRLYLGCKVVLKDDMIWRLCGVHAQYVLLDGGAYGIAKVTDYSTIKPMLRPLESMTEEEMLMIGLAHKKEWHENSLQEQFKVFLSKRDGCIYSPEDVRFLLSKHFDIFNLIPEGLALSLNS